MRYHMTLYRVAYWEVELSTWRWKSTKLNSLNSIHVFLRVYSILPKDRLRIFFASSVDMLEQMLKRENRSLPSNSVMANQFVSGERRIDVQEMRHLEAEVGI